MIQTRCVLCQSFYSAITSFRLNHIFEATRARIEMCVISSKKGSSSTFPEELGVILGRLVPHLIFSISHPREITRNTLKSPPPRFCEVRKKYSPTRIAACDTPLPALSTIVVRFMEYRSVLVARYLNYDQFYPAVVFLSTDKVSLAVMYNFAFMHSA